MEGGSPSAERSRYAMLTDDGIRRFMVESDTLYPPNAIDFSVERQREFYDALCARYATADPGGVVICNTTCAGPAGSIDVRTYRPLTTSPPPVFIYLHGGGYVVGGLDSHHAICAEIADRAGVGVVAVDYRLAPEHRFPAAFEDCQAVLQSITSIAGSAGLDASRLVVGGDSAGGCLTAAVCLDARGKAGPAIAGQVLIYPGLGGDMSAGSYVEHAHAPGLTTKDVARYHQLYIGSSDSAGHTSKFAAPLRETGYRDLPPANLVAAEWDPLRDDAYAYATRLQNAAVPAYVRHEPLLIHAFLRARHMSEPAAQSFSAIVAAVRSLAFDARLPDPQ